MVSLCCVDRISLMTSDVGIALPAFLGFLYTFFGEMSI